MLRFVVDSILENLPANDAMIHPIGSKACTFKPFFYWASLFAWLEAYTNIRQRDWLAKKQTFSQTNHVAQIDKIDKIHSREFIMYRDE